MPVIVRATSVAELRERIERFNGFHDGFLKRVEIISSDEFQDADGMRRIANGNVAVALELAHVNYRPRSERSSGVVVVKLERVTALETKMGAVGPIFPSWSIMDATAEQAADGSALAFSLWTTTKTPGAAWERELLAKFIFRSAVFEELENC